MKRFAPLLAAALLPALAGCGGGDGAAPSTAARQVPAAKTRLPVGQRLDPQHLPALPRDFLAVERSGLAVLVRLDGSVIGHLQGLHPTMHVDEPQLYGTSTAFTIDRAARRLVAFTPSLPAVRGGCTPVGRLRGETLLECPANGDRSLLAQAPDGSRRKLVPPGSARGLWIGAFASPDGKRLLLQLSDECETPFAFVAPARGGKARLVTGERAIAKAPESLALGWTRDGRALVELPRGGCGGSTTPPGVYAFRAGGSKTLVARGTEAAFFRG